MRKKKWLVGVAVCVGIILLFLSAKDESSESKTFNSGNESVAQSGLASACTSDSECVPASCCHASSCVSISERPVCDGIRCTQSCEAGTLDCGQARCECVQNVCTMVEE